jgi:hypothetical protein
MKIELSAQSFNNICKLLPSYKALSDNIYNDIMSDAARPIHEEDGYLRISTLYIWLTKELEFDYCICDWADLPVELNSQVIWLSRKVYRTSHFVRYLRPEIEHILEELEYQILTLDD